MSNYDYWAGRDDGERGATMRHSVELAAERAHNERLFGDCNRTMDSLSSRVCSEIKWKTHYKAGIESWGLKADILEKELLRIAGES